MAKLIRSAILLTCILVAGSALATTYYIAANGSDSNSGTSNTSPWQHAPGMTGCTSNCASKTPQPGDQFIFRGGDTWHHSASGKAPPGAPWKWTWSGTSGSRIYVGVDKTWFSGSSWARPILNGDNPLSTSGVGSCTYASTDFFRMNSGNFVDFDNFEFVGLCGSGSGSYSYATMQPPSHDSKFSNLYMHGWTHVTFSCSPCNPPTGQCDGGYAIAVDSHGDSSGDLNNEYDSITIDGFDSDPRSFGGFAFGGYNVHNSVIRNNSQGMVTNNTHFFHDNLIENISNSADSCKHSNSWEANGSPADLEWYNNIVRNNTAAVNVWLAAGGQIRFYNNLIYGIPSSGGNYIAYDGSKGVLMYNNTLQNNSGRGTMVGNQNHADDSWTVNDNHFITDNGSGNFAAVFASTNNVSGSNNVWQTNSAANGQGYVAGNNYTPTDPTDATVGAGANLANSCGTGFLSLCSDLLGVARPPSGAWDAGAYMFSPGGDPPNPPSGLTSVVQ